MERSFFAHAVPTPTVRVRPCPCPRPRLSVTLRGRSRKKKKKIFPRTPGKKNRTRYPKAPPNKGPVIFFFQMFNLFRPPDVGKNIKGIKWVIVPLTPD